MIGLSCSVQQFSLASVLNTAFPGSGSAIVHNHWSPWARLNTRLADGLQEVSGLVGAP